MEKILIKGTIKVGDDLFSIIHRENVTNLHLNHPNYMGNISKLSKRKCGEITNKSIQKQSEYRIIKKSQYYIIKTFTEVTKALRITF